MKQNLFLQKGVLTLLCIALTCALILSLTFLLTNGKIEKNQEKEIEKNITLLFPSGKDLKREEAEPFFDWVLKQYRFIDSKGETAAFGLVFSVKDQHTNTFLLLAKKDGSLIGLRPLLTFGAHAFPDGDYNEDFLDLFHGKKAPLYFEEEMTGSAHSDTLRPLSREVNTILSRIEKEGGAK